MNAIQRAQNDQNGEFSFVEFWWVVWDHKVLVGLITAACTAVALVMALTATPLFRATIVVTEMRESGLSADSALAGGLGGLASVAGLGLGLNAIHPERAATLRSRHLVEEFVSRPDVLPLLAAAKKKDEAPPSLWLTVERFRKNALDIQDDKLKGTTTVTIDWTDPEVARRWADEFVAMANQLLREKATDDAARNVAYLNEQLEHTTSVEIQKVMYRLIEQETRTLMLAKGRVEYAFTVVDPAVKAEVRVSPRRTLMVLSGILVGLFLGSTVAWVRERFARRRVLKSPVSGA
jgi:uncharacterized protein involved in exopolysaccharide biosynthesis